MYSVLKIGRYFISALKETFGISRDLFVIMVPVLILVHALELVGGIAWFSELIGPVMSVVGLPAEMGIVWATTLFVNIYAGMVLFVTFAPGLEMTVAEVSTLGAMMLVAHSLPVEVAVCKRSGVGVVFNVLFRLMAAIILGLLCRFLYEWTGTLDTPATSVWSPEPLPSEWLPWLAAQGLILLQITLIILVLVIVLRLLKQIGFERFMARLLKPVLRLLGLSDRVISNVIIGMTLGLSYGGGLLIQDAKRGILSPKEIFLSLSLLSILHSIIEDTLLLLLIGTHYSAAFLLRPLFALLLCALLAKFVQRLEEPTFTRFFARSVAKKTDLN